MDHNVITEHKDKITKTEAYIADLKQNKQDLVNTLNNTKNDAKSFLKDQEISFKIKGIDNEVERAESELNDLLSSKELFDKVEKQLIDFRKAHVQDSKEINNKIIAKVDEIKALKFELRKLANSLTSEMNELINESSEFLPETVKTNLGEFNSHRILSDIAIGAQGIGNYNYPLIETVNVNELLKNV